MNECLENNPCDSNAACVNTKGSYQCDCDTGYKWNPKTQRCEGTLFDSLSSLLYFLAHYIGSKFGIGLRVFFVVLYSVYQMKV